ncbi:MAG: hypothetical protein RBR67_15460 [Desulfobacterium sp.]|nr:hypothetical protein [Desulfobacterium sp.]
MKTTVKVVLQPQLIQLIDKKAIEECGDTALLYTSTYIRQLNDYINGACMLASHEIEGKVDYLAGCLTITLDNPLQELELLRARLCDGKNFENINDLTYIKRTTRTFPKAGRLNQAGQALFYASVAVKQDDTALRVVLSEAGAKELDRLNVLRSHQATGSDLNLRIIGIWDQVRRDENPYYLNKGIFDYYKKVREYMARKFDPKLLSAYELTDRFFADILSRKGSENLYRVTSALSSVFLDGKSDGVLYSSVGAKGEPVVVLVPTAVDAKIEHQFVCDVLVQECYGYEFFAYKTNAKTFSIDGATGKLNW